MTLIFLALCNFKWPIIQRYANYKSVKPSKQAVMQIIHHTYEHTFFSLAAICLFLFTWLLAMLANFLATVLGRLIGMEWVSAPSTGGTISIAVMHSSPACFVTIFIFDHLEEGLVFGMMELVAVVAIGVGFVTACNTIKRVLLGISTASLICWWMPVGALSWASYRFNFNCCHVFTTTTQITLANHLWWIAKEGIQCGSLVVG